MTHALKKVVPALLWMLALVSLAPSAAGSAAQSQCRVLYASGNGWVIDLCANDPAITTPMTIVLDGIAQGNAALVRIYHASQTGPTTPQVAVIYASGFIRLKQNADPSPSIPFGSSFILGPAYWPNASTYHHNPQLRRLTIDTSWLASGPLRMRAEGSNEQFDVDYEMALPPARDRQTRLHVTQTYTATANIAIDPTRRAERQGFKLVQVSSMFINQGGTCGNSNTDCHDSNAARYLGADGARHQVAFNSLSLPSFIYSMPQPLGSTWLDALHTDDTGWQGNTPNVRIALDVLPADRTITPQGWISATTNPNDDNVSLWLHDDGLASRAWQAGQRAQISYWLLAQDDPLEPWVDPNLRSGSTFLDFESSSNCFPAASGPSVISTIAPIAGYTDNALQLRYNLGSASGNWAQVRCDFTSPLDLSDYDHLRIDWQGTRLISNSLELGLVARHGADQLVTFFTPTYKHATQRPWWGQIVVPFNMLETRPPGIRFDASQMKVVAFFVSVVVIRDPNDGVEDDVGGAGSIAIDNLNAYNVSSRATPTTFETIRPNLRAATAAVRWLATQQRGNGLLKSWEEEDTCLAHTYDQALALIVFAHEHRWTEADRLVSALVTVQNTDGSWFQTHRCDTNPPEATASSKWEGDIAWATYALSRYLALGGTHPQAATIRDRAADWLATRINPVDGCLVIDHTEATIDAWWALQEAGRVQLADGLKQCLLTAYWDEGMGRFKGGKNWWQPYLDNQTWGAAFLTAIGEPAQARRALSYARETLRLPAQGGQLFGFDGQAGPWSVWNEGAAQYSAAGGADAQDLLVELLAQQRADGAMPGAPDDFLGAGVWTTRWHGVAPTAWLYNALCGEPFAHRVSAFCFPVYLPLVLKD